MAAKARSRNVVFALDPHTYTSLNAKFHVDGKYGCHRHLDARYRTSDEVARVAMNIRVAIVAEAVSLVNMNRKEKSPTVISVVAMMCS